MRTGRYLLVSCLPTLILSPSGQSLEPIRDRIGVAMGRLASGVHGKCRSRPRGGSMALDAQAKKVALRAVNYGLYVVTAKSGDELAGAGVNWLSQASFEPPLVMVGIKTDNDSHRLIEETGVFAVNVLGKDQLDIGKAFFRTSTVEGNKINGYDFEPGPETGCPLI